MIFTVILKIQIRFLSNWFVIGLELDMVKGVIQKTPPVIEKIGKPPVG